MSETHERRVTSTASVGSRYAAGLTFAFLLSTAEVVAVVYSLSGEAVGGAATALRSSATLVVLVTVVVLGAVGTVLAGYWIIAPSLRWYLPGIEPDAVQCRSAINIVRRQSVVLLATWAIGGAVLIVTNLDAGWRVTVLIGLSAAVGGTASFSSSFLFTQRIVRPIVAAASKESSAARRRRASPRDW